MGFFSFFSAADEEVEGSYSDVEDQRSFFFHRGDEIDEEIDKAEEREDEVDFSEEDFDDKCVSNRHDEDGREIEAGPFRWW